MKAGSVRPATRMNEDQERERLLGTRKAELNVNRTGWRNVEAQAYFRFKAHALIELGWMIFQLGG